MVLVANERRLEGLTHVAIAVARVGQVGEMERKQAQVEEERQAQQQQATQRRLPHE